MKPARVVVLTGAGVSADSGLATFRGGGGLWEGHRVEEVATPQAWDRNPALVWRFYQLRRQGLGQVEPNAAHRALARFEEVLRRSGGSFTLITQNVDDLHERAGACSLLHMHGELAVLVCQQCGHKLRDLEQVDPESFVPCERCGAPRLRPDVVWFGEIPHHLPAIELALEGCTEFWALGTSGVVYPAAGFLERARSAGALTCVQSLDPPENLHPGDEFLPGRAAEVLPAFLEARLAGWGLVAPDPPG